MLYHSMLVMRVHVLACPQPFDSTPLAFSNMAFLDDDGWPLTASCQVCLQIAFVRAGSVVCNVCRKYIGESNEPFAGRVAATAANSSSSSSGNNIAVDVAMGDVYEGQEEPTQEEHHSSGFIVRKDGIVEPAPGHGKYRPHRKRGAASRTKSRASYHERWG